MLHVFLRLYAPDFAYVTMEDLFRMARHFYPGQDFTREQMKKAVQHARSKGIIESFPDNIDAGRSKVFKRK